MGNKDYYAFDEQSARRVARAVRADEQNRPDLLSKPSHPVQTPQVYHMVRVDNGGDPVTATTVKGVFVGIDTGFDFDELVGHCDPNPPTIPADAPRWDVNHESFIEGCAFVGDIFQAVNIGGKWHAIGTGHTQVSGTYDGASGSLVLSGCSDIKVPVQSIFPGMTLTDGDEYIAVWVRSQRIYVVTASGCTEVSEPFDCQGCEFRCLTADIPGFTIAASSCVVPSTTLTFRHDPDANGCIYPADSNAYLTTASISWTGSFWRMTFAAAVGSGGNCPVGTGSFSYKCDTCVGSYVFESREFSGETGNPAGPIDVSAC